MWGFGRGWRSGQAGVGGSRKDSHWAASVRSRSVLRVIHSGWNSSRSSMPSRSLVRAPLRLWAREVVEADCGLDDGVVEEAERVGGLAPNVLQGLVAFPELAVVELLDGAVEFGRRVRRLGAGELLDSVLAEGVGPLGVEGAPVAGNGRVGRPVRGSVVMEGGFRGRLTDLLLDDLSKTLLVFP